MSRIIKAAELEVLIPNDSQTVIPAPASIRETSATHENHTLLKSANLVQEAQRKATEILRDAKEQAQSILDSADEEVEIARLQAKEQGFEEGLQEGRVEGKQSAIEEAGNLLSLLQSTVEEATVLRVNNLESLEDDFLKFSLLLADKIVKKQVSGDISWLNPVVRDALGALGSVDKIIIRVNPEDYDLIIEYEEALELNSRVSIEFEADSSISPGGCLIESDKGLIDARLEKRLGKIATHLMEVLYDEQN